MEKYKFLKTFLTLLLLLVFTGTVYSSPSVQDYVTIETKDMDTYIGNYWMHLMIRLTNTSNNMIDLDGIELRYSYTDSKMNQVVLDSTYVYWFNTHSPDWQYDYGSKADVKIWSVVTDSASSPKKGIICIRFYNGKLYPNGGEANVEFGVHKSDWSNFYELDDPSYIHTTTFVQNANVPVQANRYTPLQLSDMRVYSEFDSNVLAIDLNPSLPISADTRRLRELVRMNGDIPSKTLCTPQTMSGPFAGIILNYTRLFCLKLASAR
jgi:hypothetical protein